MRILRLRHSVPVDHPARSGRARAFAGAPLEIWWARAARPATWTGPEPWAQPPGQP